MSAGPSLKSLLQLERALPLSFFQATLLEAIDEQKGITTIELTELLDNDKKNMIGYLMWFRRNGYLKSLPGSRIPGKQGPGFNLWFLTRKGSGALKRCRSAVAKSKIVMDEPV